MLRALVKLLVWSTATSLEIISCSGEEGQTGIMVTFGEIQGAGSWEMAVWKKQPMSHPEGQRDFLGGLFLPSTESGESGPALQPPSF